jgi:acetyl-CoA carboxylase carboxyl transferase subunit alpha
MVVDKGMMVKLSEDFHSDFNENQIRGSFQKVLLARANDRPFALDIIENIFSEFIEVKGDRRFSDDKSLICGFASFNGRGVVVVGQQKGRDTKQRQFRNFGMPKPEGYRKALRMMRIAEKFNVPIFTFVDTPGAFPGVDAEERGQSEAIARNLLEMAKIRVPIIVTILGEGGSGGALAIAVGDKVLMFENSIYSVISPEGCAAILWKDASQAPRAAYSLKLTADDLLSLRIIDEIIREQENARSGLEDFYKGLYDVLKENLESVIEMDAGELIERRYEKLRKLAYWGSPVT